MKNPVIFLKNLVTKVRSIFVIPPKDISTVPIPVSEACFNMYQLRHKEMNTYSLMELNRVLDLGG